MAIQPNGKIVVGGSSNRTLALARYQRGGQLDPTFSANGKLRRRLEGARAAADIALQPDGKIVVLGWSGQDAVLARFNRGGTLDRSFSGDGRLVTDLAIDMTLDGDGRIVLAGLRPGAGLFSADATLARFQPDGAPDTSFSGDGVVIASFAGYNHAVGTAVAVEPGGKLVLGVEATTGEPDYLTDAALARFELDGDLDPSFSGDGTTTLNFGPVADTSKVAVRPDGRIVVAGGACSDPSELYGGCAGRVAQLDSDGSLDDSFGEQGFAGLPAVRGLHFPSLVNSAAITEDGGTVLAVDLETDRQDIGLLDFALARLDAAGSLDASFRGRGFWATDFLSETDYAVEVALQRNGKIVVVGGSYAVGSSYRDSKVAQIALARYDVESGPRDADADGVRDRLDRCPFRFGQHHGCRWYRRALTMEFHRRRDLFLGVLRARDANCVRGEKVRVLRAQPGRDFRVDMTHTNFLGRWKVDARLHPGRYYARASASESADGEAGFGEQGTGTRYGRCLNARADGFRI